MPPRKSLPASLITPVRVARTETISSKSTLKKSRSSKNQIGSSPDPIALKPSVRSRGKAKNQKEIEENHDEIQEEDERKVDNQEGGKGNELNPEKELEAWQDFAADHYEMVEQLPLELHRNFRLLRELDDGCIAQTKRLHELIRHYVNERLELEKQIQKRKDVSVQIEEEEEVEEIEKIDNPVESDSLPENGHIEVTGGNDIEVGMKDSKDTAGEHAEEAARDEKNDEELLNGKQITEGIPISDGQGGLLIPVEPRLQEPRDELPQETTKDDVPPRLEFPPRSEDSVSEKKQVRDNEDSMQIVGPGATGISPPLPVENGQSSKETLQAENKKRKRQDGPHAHLPEIARLSREVIRTAEEKVAVAVGAYNAIDRHIRALDSALTAQEASILLGLRPSTLPSTNAEDALNLAGDLHAAPQFEEEEMNIGLGGGRSRKKGKNRKGRKGAPIVEEQVVPPDVDFVSSNEPRYCYCNQVSYGQMIGCENEDCPIEWFHLTCCELETAPTGKWYCNLCKIETGLGKGGSVRLGNKAVIGNHSRKKR
uniref:Chromatin modification-related protein n=1 Tax=Kwoniella pini CBS 10737 TaxID=1296096 RepID=A0A1B9I499_9TREE|nr:uncharacterized protein I206_03657 [Kwoniella pini CBS 10737]OCF50338.1 hypothetical protein I206_03657 [Kwoniella pini CBS 10737]